MAPEVNQSVEVLDVLTPTDRAAVLSLVDRAAAADGIDPLSEHTVLHVRHGGSNDRSMVVRDPSDPALVRGFAHLDTADPAARASGELVVDPTHRTEGIGAALVRSLIDAAPDGRLDLWAHGTHPGAEALAKSLGFRRSRVLWQMRRSLGEQLPAAVLPAGVSVRTFQPGKDDVAWLALNTLAFAHHPEQGLWTAEDLARRQLQHWFDPAGFFIAERDTRMVGFHWTKIHGDLGEVYVLGVDPREQGGGLGRALTIIGLEHLRRKGIEQSMLYVDEVNTPAIGVYERLGFTHWLTDIRFSR